MPPTKDLENFVNNIALAAVHFSVSERTIRRWMHTSGLKEKKIGWGPKLSQEQVDHIHQLDDDGVKVVQIAKLFNVSHPAISKILSGRNHRSKTGNTAIVNVIYNTN